MSFNPKLIHDDDDSSWPQSSDGERFEQHLPDDLLALAAQLRADADHLENHYPADEPQRWAQPALAQPHWTSRFAVAASMAAVGVAGALWLTWPAASSPPAVAPVVTMPVHQPTLAPGVFQALSGPEQEALLDLMESESLGQASLSI